MLYESCGLDLNGSLKLMEIQDTTKCRSYCFLFKEAAFLMLFSIAEFVELATNKVVTLWFYQQIKFQNYFPGIKH